MPALADHNTMDGHLEVVRTVTDEYISAELVELQRRGDVERAVREAFDLGASVDDLSDASGLRPSEIRKIVARIELEDLEALVGLR